MLRDGRENKDGILCVWILFEAGLLSECEHLSRITHLPDFMDHRRSLRMSEILFAHKKGDRHARCYGYLGTGLILWLKVYTRVRLLQLEWQAEPKRERDSKTSLSTEDL